MNFEQILQQIVNWLTTEGLRILLGLIVLFILFKVINIVCRKIAKSLNKRNMDKALSGVVLTTSRKALKILAFICFLGYIGIETTSIAAAIVSIGVAIGAALQGSLSNIAGGVLILTTRPFKIGDYIVIEANDEEGTVENIELFHTYITTNDNRVIIVPNSVASSNTVINYSLKENRRVDMVFQVAYENDFEKAKQIILDCARDTGYLLEDPAPFVGVMAHSASSVDISAKLWCKNEDYWNLKYAMMEKVKKAFDENGISIPYQQIDVHIANK